MSALILLVVLASCDTSSSGPSTTGPALSEPTLPASSSSSSSPTNDVGLESDLDLIEELWRQHNREWLKGFEHGVSFWADNNYPAMGCTFEDYMLSRFPDGPVEGLVIERVPNLPTVTLDEGWVIPGGRLGGTQAMGRVYSMAVRSLRTSSQEPISTPEFLDLHVTILEGRAYFFLGCS